MTEIQHPDWVSPPGDTITDILEERGWSQAELATRLGYSEKHVSLLLNGKVSITEESALRLERVLGSTAGFWLRLEAFYREQLARRGEEIVLASWAAWLDRLPIKELMKAGAITSRRVTSRTRSAVVKDALQFFGIASPEEWTQQYENMQASFRRTRTEQSDVGAISAWLRLGEIRAEKLEGPKYDAAIFRDVLKFIREMTANANGDWEEAIQKECRKAGVVFVIVPSIPRAHVSGVARWLGSSKPIIQVSLYGKSNDRFWFTFFHEAAHILLHSKKDVFLDEYEGTSVSSLQEQQANDWARDLLIPPERANELKYLKKKDQVRAFAASVGVHPAIVVGRLQHEQLIEKSWMNDLKMLSGRPVSA